MTETQFKNLWKHISHKYKNKVKFEKIDLNNGFLNLNLYAEFDVDLDNLEKDLDNISNKEVKFFIKQTGLNGVTTPCPLLLKSNFNNYFTIKEIQDLNKLIDIEVIWLKSDISDYKGDIPISIMQKLINMGLNQQFDWLLIVEDQNSNFF